MAKMRAVQVSQAKGPLEIVERDIPEPQPGWVRVKVEACGVCHSDSLTKEGLWPGIQYPRVPGHEVIGVIDTVGSDVPNWTAGQRVGVGWHAFKLRSLRPLSTRRFLCLPGGIAHRPAFPSTAATPNT